MSWRILERAKLLDGSEITLSRQWLGYDIDWERNGNRRCLAFEIKEENDARDKFKEIIKRGAK